MTVSSDFQLWGLGSALSMARSALMNDKLNHVFAELDTGDQAVGVHAHSGSCLCSMYHPDNFLVNVNTFISYNLV